MRKFAEDGAIDGADSGRIGRGHDAFLDGECGVCSVGAERLRV